MPEAARVALVQMLAVLSFLRLKSTPGFKQTLCPCSPDSFLKASSIFLESSADYFMILSPVFCLRKMLTLLFSFPSLCSVLVCEMFF